MVLKNIQFDFHLSISAPKTPKESSHLRKLAYYSTKRSKDSSGCWTDLSVLFIVFRGNQNIAWTFIVTGMASKVSLILNDLLSPGRCHHTPQFLPFSNVTRVVSSNDCFPQLFTNFHKPFFYTVHPNSCDFQLSSYISWQFTVDRAQARELPSCLPHVPISSQVTCKMMKEIDTFRA